MKKRILNDDELNEVIEAKQKGLNWSQIKEKTGIQRAVSKREYEEWLRKQSSDKLNGIRLKLAEEEFIQHRNHILRVADFFVESLDEPTQYDKKLYDSSWLIHKMENSNLFQGSEVSPDGYEKNIVYNNKLLFRALKEHTKERIPWDILNKWQQSWDNFKLFFEEFTRDLNDISLNIADSQKIKYMDVYSKGNATTDRLVEIIEIYLLPAIKEVVLDVDLLKGITLVETLKDDKGNVQSISPTFVEAVMQQAKNRKIPKELTSVCRQILENTCRRIDPEKLRGVVKSVRTMRNAISLFQESLNPLTLRPLILRTRCNLCPI